MAAGIFHHIAIEVSDIDRASKFYTRALGARPLTSPQLIEGELASTVMGGPIGTAFVVCRLAFDPGCLELFQFVGEVGPAWAGQRLRGCVPHFGVQVADFDEAVQRIESAGGRRLWAEAEVWGPARTLYTADPDGNAFELCDTTLPRLVEFLIGLSPSLGPVEER